MKRFILPTDCGILLATTETNIFLRKGDNGFNLREYIRDNAHGSIQCVVIIAQIFNEKHEELTTEFDCNGVILDFTDHRDSVYYKLAFDGIEDENDSTANH